MKNVNVLTFREKMENVLHSAGEALIMGVNMKTVVKQLDENGLRIYENDTESTQRIVTSNEPQNENETELWFDKSMDRKIMVYILSFGYDNQFETPN